ncbi:unnamed protein product [Mytilus edulis]|uniref:Uncharacterized protein n=1 Tax=Mytilus edulis TaxID=6550 RepID=A0A8S3UZU4_MYTED|nr:unnamed protein product [Mytilus edulis]
MAYNILHNTQQEGCNLQLIKTNEEKINKMKFGTAFLQTKPVEKLLCIGISVGILIILVFFLAIGIVIYYSGRCHGTTLTDTQLRQMMVAINQESPDNSDRPKESTSESEVDTGFDSTTHDTTRDTSLTRTIGGSCGKKNLAFQKKCGQSSYMDGYECGLAVDGNFNTYIHTTYFWKNNAYHGESNPYWWRTNGSTLRQGDDEGPEYRRNNTKLR